VAPGIALGVNATILGDRPSGLGVYTAAVLRELIARAPDLLAYASVDAIPGVPRDALRAVSPRTRPERGAAGHLARLLWAQTVLPRRLAADRRALLLTTFPEGMLRPRIPQVCVVHDLIAVRYREHFPRLSRYFARILPLVLRRCAAVVVDSEATRRDVVQLLNVTGVRIEVIYPGYDADRFRPGLDAAAARRRWALDRYVLFVGALLPHKNVGGLLRAFAAIAGRVPHQLVIAGGRDPRFAAGLAAEAAALGIADRVRWLDYVAAADLPSLYAGADVYVHPSLYEGFGLTVLEAMACGVPVVSGRGGSLPEVGGDAVRWTAADRVEDMAAALCETLGDAGLRARLSEAGPARAQMFSWARTARGILELLEEVGRAT
jgi:glycosyltransferase involved in cell wall biosynthesis